MPDVIQNDQSEGLEQEQFPVSSNNDVTFVTGLWDLGRGNIGTSFHRDYQTYLTKLTELLKIPVNLFIYIDKADEDLIWKHRSRDNTVVRHMNLAELEEWFPFTSQTDAIRQKPEWLAQAGWLPDSTQARLKMYNPLVMSKMFMLNNVTIWNPFDSKQFYWIDAGITNTVHSGYFTHDKVQDKLLTYNKDKLLFIAFPYPDGGEIHGFTRTRINEIAQTENVEYVCRGGFFGGPRKNINDANDVYYHLLRETLEEGLMGTEESIFTIMSYLRPENIKLHMIEGNGLVGKFFEDLKNYDVSIDIKEYSGTGLYVITFNSPKQFNALVESYLKHPGFIKETKNYLLDNSNDPSVTNDYQQLCEKYNFTHIKKDNIGICGGRQFIAEHFNTTNEKYYIFLEDDMNLRDKPISVCSNGFATYTDNLYDKIHKIMDKSKLDFLKLSYTEFYGDNSTQWAWYNVPQAVRERFWPGKKRLPHLGLDPNSPLTEFKNIKTIDGLSYITGDIYYCNWPQIISKEGNKKMFLDTTWAHPFEQTWMSYMYQLSKEGGLQSGVLLLSPINHHRFEHYSGELRREN